MECIVEYSYHRCIVHHHTVSLLFLYPIVIVIVVLTCVDRIHSSYAKIRMCVHMLDSQQRFIHTLPFAKA